MARDKGLDHNRGQALCLLTCSTGPHLKVRDGGRLRGPGRGGFGLSLEMSAGVAQWTPCPDPTRHPGRPADHLQSGESFPSPRISGGSAQEVHANPTRRFLVKNGITRFGHQGFSAGRYDLKDHYLLPCAGLRQTHVGSESVWFPPAAPPQCDED